MHSYCIQSSERVSGRGPKWLKGWNTLGNNWQQHIVTISCSDKSPYVYWRIFVQICLCNRILSLQQVKQNQTRLWAFVWLAVAKIVLWRQDFHKNSQYTQYHLLLQSVTQLVALKITCTQSWFVATTNCSDISPCVWPTFTVYCRLLGLPSAFPHKPEICHEPGNHPGSHFMHLLSTSHKIITYLEIIC